MPCECVGRIVHLSLSPQPTYNRCIAVCPCLQMHAGPPVRAERAPGRQRGRQELCLGRSPGNQGGMALQTVGHCTAWPTAKCACMVCRPLKAWHDASLLQGDCTQLRESITALRAELAAQQRAAAEAAAAARSAAEDAARHAERQAAQIASLTSRLQVGGDVIVEISQQVRMECGACLQVTALAA